MILGIHGTEGPMYVTDLRQTKVVDTFLGAAKELGESLINVNDGHQKGVYFVDVSFNQHYLSNL